MNPGRLIFHVADNNGRNRETGLWMPAAVAPGLVLSFANLARGPLLALTSARLVGAEYIVKVADWGAGLGLPGSDSRRSATLFYSNGPGVARLVLPSPVAGLAETTGPLAGFRITRASAAAAGLLDELELIVAGTVQPNGEPWPPLFDNGAIDERM